MKRLCLIYLLIVTILTGCSLSESPDDGGGLFAGHKKLENRYTLNVPTSGEYHVGDIITFSLTHTNIINVEDGVPYVEIDIGGVLVNANYVSGSGSRTLDFEYTVTVSDNDVDGIEIQGTIAPNGASLSFYNGAVYENSALTFTQKETPDVTVEWINTTIISINAPVDSTYNLIQDLNFIVNFNQSVTITNFPRIILTVGAFTRYANYSSGSGSNSLIFTYDTQNNDFDNNGISFSSMLIGLNSGTLKDAAGNDVGLDFTAYAPSLTSVFVDTTSAPIMPTALSLLNPTESPGSDDSPEISVSGVISGYLVKLFTDALCTDEIGSAVAASGTVSITSSNLVEGKYTIYANSTINGQTSFCSSAKVAYTFSTVQIIQTLSGAGLNTSTSVWADSSGNNIDAKLVNSNASSFDGVDDYIDAPHLTGAETVVSNDGTAIASISAGRIDFTAGSLFNLLLSDGTYYPMSEGAGTQIFDVSGNGNHGTATNITDSTFWGNKQDLFHYNLSKGFTSLAEENYARFGDNNGNDQSWVEAKEAIDYNSNKYYKYTVTARKTHGASARAYTGFSGRNAANTRWYNRTGANTFSSQHYFPLAAKNLPAGFTSYVGYAHGLGTPNASGSGTLGSPMRMHSSVRKVRPVLLVNYPNVSGITDVSYISIHEVDSSGNEISLLFEEDFKGSVTDRWQRYSGSFIPQVSNGVKVPALLSGTLDALGSSISNTAGTFHNGAETGIQRNPTDDPLLTNATPSITSANVWYYGDANISNLFIKQDNKGNRTEFVTFDSSPY